VISLLTRWPYGHVTNHGFRVESKGAETSQSRMIETIARLLAMAHVMGAPTEVDRALANQSRGNLAAAAEQLHQINSNNAAANSSNIFTQSLEAQARVEMGDHASAAEIYDAVDQQLPSEHETDGWEKLANTPSPVLPLPAQPLEELAIPTPKKHAVMSDLFDANILSYQVVERFEQRYVNKRVEWSGIVTNNHKYRHDSDFGEGPGQKTTVLLGTAPPRTVLGPRAGRSGENNCS